MKAKRTILFFLFLSVLIPQVRAANFGEDDPYLGQVIDDYENDDYLNITSDVIRNSTLECMELDLVPVGGDFENYTLYTEVDNANDRITFYSDTAIRHVSSRAEETYLYRNYGEKIFYIYDITFEVLIDSEQEYARGIPFMLSNYTGGQKAHIDNNQGYSAMFFYRSSSPPRYVFLAASNNSYGASDSKSLYDLDKWYYCRVRQNQTHIALWMYEDEAHTILWWYTDLVFSPEYYSHIYCANGYKTTGGYLIDYDVKNMILFEGIGYDSGYYTTIDMLNGDYGIALLYNATIPGGTGMTIEFFNGSAWVDHNNEPGSDSCVDGYEAFDIRDIYPSTGIVRINQTGGVNTPLMNQLRWITVTTITAAGGLFPGLAIGISLLIIVTIYALEKRR